MSLHWALKIWKEGSLGCLWALHENTEPGYRKRAQGKEYGLDTGGAGRTARLRSAWPTAKGSRVLWGSSIRRQKQDSKFKASQGYTVRRERERLSWQTACYTSLKTWVWMPKHLRDSRVLQRVSVTSTLVPGWGRDKQLSGVCCPYLGPIRPALPGPLP